MERGRARFHHIKYCCSCFFFQLISCKLELNFITPEHNNGKECRGSRTKNPRRKKLESFSCPFFTVPCPGSVPLLTACFGAFFCNPNETLKRNYSLVVDWLVAQRVNSHVSPSPSLPTEKKSCFKTGSTRTTNNRNRIAEVRPKPKAPPAVPWEEHYFNLRIVQKQRLALNKTKYRNANYRTM